MSTTPDSEAISLQWLNELPDGYPAGPDGLVPVDRASDPESRDGRIVEAGHRLLDDYGVPRTKTLNEEETVGGVKAERVLRLHGRIGLLLDKLSELEISGADLFPADER